MFAWIDYSCAMQEDYTVKCATLNALPLYMSCCDEFAYMNHDSARGKRLNKRYEARAWCCAEQGAVACAAPATICTGNQRHKC